MSKKAMLRDVDRSVSCAGKSLREIMEMALDETVEDIMIGLGEEDPLILKGKALGIAECIALILQPYSPNVDAVRSAAMERFYEANPEYLDEEDEDTDGE